MTTWEHPDGEAYARGWRDALMTLRFMLTEDDFPFFNRHPHHTTKETWAMWAERDVTGLIGRMLEAGGGPDAPSDARSGAMRAQAAKDGAIRASSPADSRPPLSTASTCTPVDNSARTPPVDNPPGKAGFAGGWRRRESNPRSRLSGDAGGGS